MLLDTLETNMLYLSREVDLMKANILQKSTLLGQVHVSVKSFLAIEISWFS